MSPLSQSVTDASSGLRSFSAVWQRELQLGWRGIGDFLVQSVFFIMIAMLFPLAVGPAPATLTELAISLIWIAALLSALPGFDRMFADDFRSGWLEQVCLSAQPLWLYVIAKITSWLVLSILPLGGVLPILFVFFNLPFSLFFILFGALCLSLTGLTCLGAITASLTIGARRTSLLVALLILPLSLPVLIFGVLSAEAALWGEAVAPHLKLLGGTVLFLGVLGPFASAHALKTALEER